MKYLLHIQLFQLLFFCWLTFNEAMGQNMKATSSVTLFNKFKDLSSKVDEMGESPLFEFGKVMTTVIDGNVDSRDTSIVIYFSDSYLILELIDASYVQDSFELQDLYNKYIDKCKILSIRNLTFKLINVYL